MANNKMIFKTIIIELRIHRNTLLYGIPLPPAARSSDHHPPHQATTNVFTKEQIILQSQESYSLLRYVLKKENNFIEIAPPISLRQVNIITPRIAAKQVCSHRYCLSKRLWQLQVSYNLLTHVRNNGTVSIVLVWLCKVKKRYHWNNLSLYEKLPVYFHNKYGIWQFKVNYDHGT